MSSSSDSLETSSDEEDDYQGLRMKDDIIAAFDMDPRSFLPVWDETTPGVIRITVHRNIEGQRELVGFIVHKAKTGTVEIANFNANLSIDDLSIGGSTKRNNDKFAGVHGEGLKVAALVMVRSGMPVRIQSTSANWNFGFNGVNKDRFYCKISKPNIIKLSHPATGRGCRKPITAEEFRGWTTVSLDLSNPDPDKMIRTQHGDLVLDERFAGQIYLKWFKVDIILNDIKRQPRKLAKELWRLLVKYDCARNPQQERIRLFSSSQPVGNVDGYFSLNISRADTTIDLHFDPKSEVLQINHRWLNFGAVHVETPCEFFEIAKHDDVNDIFYCDHVVEDLLELAMNHIRDYVDISPSKAIELRRQAREYIRQTPRGVQVSTTSKACELQVHWLRNNYELVSRNYLEKKVCNVKLHSLSTCETRHEDLMINTGCVEERHLSVTRFSILRQEYLFRGGRKLDESAEIGDLMLHFSSVQHMGEQSDAEVVMIKDITFAKAFSTSFRVRYRPVCHTHSYVPANVDGSSTTEEDAKKELSCRFARSPRIEPELKESFLDPLDIMDSITKSNFDPDFLVLQMPPGVFHPNVFERFSSTIFQLLEKGETVCVNISSLQSFGCARQRYLVNTVASRFPGLAVVPIKLAAHRTEDDEFTLITDLIKDLSFLNPRQTESSEEVRGQFMQEILNVRAA
ncbi:hypothetical protein K4K55_001645 [Colletotrichum sp. SAR 10_96]|nr:hypothetical protein K4K55_001645 [Colletotrichum sp. SAR 10_96]